MDEASFFQRSSNISNTSFNPESTRSIVMALRGLQEKIQTLEADRNHYKSSYERLLQTHETQIRENRQRFERENEENAQTLVKLTLEKDRLQNQVEDLKTQLQHTQREYETLVRQEKVKTERLEEEHVKDRVTAHESREKIAELRAQLEEALRQRDSSESAARRLSEAMKEFVSLNTSLVERLGGTHTNSGNNTHHQPPISQLSPRYASPTTTSRLKGPPSREASPARMHKSPAPQVSSSATALLKDLELEYGELLSRFKTAVSSSNNAPLTDKGLHAIVEAMERKADQIALLRKGEKLRSPQRFGSNGRSGGYRSGTPPVRGLEKRKVTLQTVQELRNIVQSTK
eukprot:PhF_6_TR33006/c0_g1_i1/m.48637